MTAFSLPYHFFMGSNAYHCRFQALILIRPFLRQFGFQGCKSFIPSITLAPEQIGHLSPVERLFGLACHSCPQEPLSTILIYLSRRLSYPVKGRFRSDHSRHKLRCIDAKLLLISNPRPPLQTQYIELEMH